jgi:hypothetical protein
LKKGAIETLIAMAQQADQSLQQEFGLPLGLIIIDTVSACAGYAKAGDESDSAAAQAVMNALKAVAEALGCFVLGVDHFGKNVEAGTRGASSKESASDLVLACLGDKSLSGSVANTRLALRKNRGGQQGQEHPFTLRVGEAPEPTIWGSRSPPWLWIGSQIHQAESGRSNLTVGPKPSTRSAHRSPAAEARDNGLDGRAWHRTADPAGRAGGPDDRPKGGPRVVLCPDPGGRQPETKG